MPKVPKKSNPTGVHQKKKILNFLLYVSGFVGTFLFFISARQSTLSNLPFGFSILQVHPCCVQAQIRAGFSPVWGVRKGGFGLWDPQ